MRCLLVTILTACCLLSVTAAEHDDRDVEVFDADPAEKNTAESKDAQHDEAHQADREDGEEDNKEDSEDDEFEALMDRVHSFLKREDAPLEALLRELKDFDGEAYVDAVDGFAWEVLEFVEMAEDGDWGIDERNKIQARIKGQLKEARLRVQLQLLSRKFHRSKGSDKNIEDEIKKTVPQLFAVLLERRQQRLQELRQEIKELEAEVQELQENKEAIIQKKINDVTDRDLLDW